MEMVGQGDDMYVSICMYVRWTGPLQRYARAAPSRTKPRGCAYGVIRRGSRGARRVSKWACLYVWTHATTFVGCSIHSLHATPTHSPVRTSPPVSATAPFRTPLILSSDAT